MPESKFREKLKTRLQTRASKMLEASAKKTGKAANEKPPHPDLESQEAEKQEKKCGRVLQRKLGAPTSLPRKENTDPNVPTSSSALVFNDPSANNQVTKVRSDKGNVDENVASASASDKPVPIGFKYPEEAWPPRSQTMTNFGRSPKKTSPNVTPTKISPDVTPRNSQNPSSPNPLHTQSTPTDDPHHEVLTEIILDGAPINIESVVFEIRNTEIPPTVPCSAQTVQQRRLSEGGSAVENPPGLQEEVSAQTTPTAHCSYQRDDQSKNDDVQQDEQSAQGDYGDGQSDHSDHSDDDEDSPNDTPRQSNTSATDNSSFENNSSEYIYTHLYCI